MLPAEIWSIAQTNQGSVILLRPKDTETAVPVFTGKPEMQSILIGKEGVSLPRPLTHDLILKIFSITGLNLERVEMHELKNDVFHARLVISGNGFSAESPLLLDSRPSDAFALAVRKRCPIFVDAAVVEQAGVPLDFFFDAIEEAGEDDAAFKDIVLKNPELSGRAPGESGNFSGSKKHRRLLGLLNRAIASEDYERAAEIRDMLRALGAGATG